MYRPKLGRLSCRLDIEQEIDIALLVAHYGLGTMSRYGREPQRFEQAPEGCGILTRELNELEAIGSQRKLVSPFVLHLERVFYVISPMFGRSASGTHYTQR